MNQPTRKKKAWERQSKPLSLSNAINHLGHILTHNLSDDEDIIAISKDMCREANHLLHIFSCCDPSVKTQLFSSFCLSLYGAALWRVSCPQLRALEVSFNNILRKIWSLPRQSHTGIVHSVAGLQSIYNISNCLLCMPAFLSFRALKFIILSIIHAW